MNSTTDKRPQSYQQITEVLDTLESVHTELGRLCRIVASSGAGPRRYRMLGDVFARRQRSMAALMARSRMKLVGGMGTTWVQYAPTDRIDRALAELKAQGPPDPIQMPVTVVELQNAIVALLDVVRSNVPSTELDDFLEALGSTEFEEAKATTEIIQDMDQA